MLDIEHVKGILIAPDGKQKSFGALLYGTTEDLTEDNYHDVSFNKEILPTTWFQKLQQELNFNYNKEDTIHRQVMVMASKGIITILNCSSITSSQGEYNAYCLHCPEQLTTNQKELLENSYTELKTLIEEKDAYFEATGYDTNEDYIWDDFVYDLDDFYDRMNLCKVEERKRGK